MAAMHGLLPLLLCLCLSLAPACRHRGKTYQNNEQWVSAWGEEGGAAGGEGGLPHEVLHKRQRQLANRSDGLRDTVESECEAARG